MKEYFREGAKIEDETREQIRPLGPLSDYVINVLPTNLAEGRIGDILRETEILAETVRVEAVDPALASVARLDVLLIDRALAQHLEEPGTNLASLIEDLSTICERPPVLTYEDIVLNNPSGDIRTFTGGEVGAAEADFYRLHQDSERDLAQIAEALDHARWQLQAGSVEAAAELLDMATLAFDDLNVHTETVGQAMPKGLYDEFRPYLLSHPLSGAKGPSGAFSAGIPSIELMLAGENLPPAHFAFFTENAAYFPNQGRTLLQLGAEARTGLSLRSLCLAAGKPEAVWTKLHLIEEKIRYWRGIHRRGVEVQLPHALTYKTIGTSGEPDAAAFLNERLKHRLVEE